MEIRDRIVELRRVPARELRANPKNWRTHPPEQVNAMRQVLDRIGFARAALARVDADGSLVLLDGHARRDLADDQEIPVLVTDLSEEEGEYALLTHDPIGAMAEAEADNLRHLLERFADEDGAVRRMLDGLRDEYLDAERPHGKTDPDDVPPTPAKATTKPGDLWRLGEHRLQCGDATKAEDVARLMDGERAALLWTDPPYGVAYVGKTADALRISNDGPEGLTALLAATWAAVCPALAPGAPFYIAHPAGPRGLEFALTLKEAGWQVHQTLVWLKDSMVLGHSDYHYRHEPILYGWLPGPGRSGRGRHEGTRWFGGNAETSVFEVPRPKASPEHPTGKPVALVERQVANSSLPGEIVLEPFSGSGTTLIAAARLGRRCYAMELEPRYVDVAVRRWEAYTGGKAER